MDYLAALLAISGVLVLSVVSPGPNFAIVTSTARAVPVWPPGLAWQLPPPPGRCWLSPGWG
ncbi:hypothetical protein [Pseudomonas sp. JG-B]|uniref:hypothetical protein n=1 Tax=Pseudomonas sp. JG-B TaxID=2603214 RepID=UPI001C49B59B|nr:hypothetical protein [Pseudomonas sp. JG-B]